MGIKQSKLKTGKAVHGTAIDYNAVRTGVVRKSLTATGIGVNLLP
jgi:hypothetical protein